MKPKSIHLPPLDLAAISKLAAGRTLRMDSRQIQHGDVFLAFPGERADGRQHLVAAVARGASAILWESEGFAWPAEHAGVANLGVPQLRLQAGLIAAHLAGEPSKNMWCVGVTGTNGKTSCAHWLAQAFGLLQHKTMLVGTIGYGFIDSLGDASHTTPDALTLQTLIADYRAQGASHLSMEVSSHALDQGRAHGVAFDIGVFTNLTRDHLDYHGDMASYGAAKRKLFEWEGLKAAIINADEPFGAEMLATLPAGLALGYGMDGGELRATRIDTSLDGLSIQIESPWGKAELHSPLVGRFNAYNLLACLGVLLKSGVALDTSVAVLGQIVSAKGRMQRLGGDSKPLVVVDYAHTPDALEKALITLREAMPQVGRLYCVFGCGGDRDRGKRPIMGRIACTWADTVIVTSDNPRTEDPKRIIRDIVDGVDGVTADTQLRGDYTVQSDRAAAIRSAIEVAQVGDVVLIAGKGHEEYQDVDGEKHPFSDEQHALAALTAWKPLN